MVGRGLEPRPFGLQPSALPVVLTNHVMFVEGFEPSTSGFVDQRSIFPLSYTNIKSGWPIWVANLGGQSGWQDSNLRRLAPKASGQPLPHTQKLNGTGGNRTHNFQFARLAPFQFGYDPKLSYKQQLAKIGAVGIEPTTIGL